MTNRLRKQSGTPADKGLLSEPTDTEIETVNRRFLELKKKLKGAERRLPIVVEFIGPPKAYKTTVRDMVGRLTEKCGFRVFRPIEGASLPSQRVLRENLTAFNAWTGTYALQNLLESCLPVNRYDIVLFDRGVIDAQVWFEALGSLNWTRKESVCAVENFFGLPDWTRFIDMVVELVCDPLTSENREEKGHLIRVERVATSRDVLEALVKSYQSRKWLTGCGVEATKVLSVDTSSMDCLPRAVAIIVANHLADLLEEVVDPPFLVTPSELVRFKGFLPRDEVNEDEWEDRATYSRKSIAETDSTVKQIVSYGFVMVGENILGLHRTGPSNRPELQSKKSIGVGGHVEKRDVRNGEEFALSLERCIRRELEEELVFDGEPKIEFCGWVNDESIEAGLHHVAAVHRVTLPKGRVRVRSGVVDQEFGEESWKIVPIDNICKDWKSYDPWSQWMIHKILGGPAPELRNQRLVRYK